ncbi:VOC family protein [Pendulispora albinea]|uniref:VOC family protein n=1 Tax=Pendulispora albinea TaxID=2741071 RepID=A0ABZ2M799_9BACT
MSAKQKIVTFLWFDSNAEEAVNHYTSIFKDSAIVDVTRYPDTGPGPNGKVMTVTFELEGQRFIALNGGPQYEFTEAVSLFVNCETQAEVDTLWSKLSAGGEPGPCGWLKDKYGLSWQIVPSRLMEMVQNKKDPAKAKRAFEAMLQMKKLDLAALQRAYDEG